MLGTMGSPPPPKHLYFDSNILRNWPNCSNEIWNVFSAAKWLKTKIYIPKIVEDELEGQFVRSVNSAFAAMQANLKDLNKICRNIIGPNVAGTIPSESQLRDAFTTRSAEIKSHFNILTVPITNISLDVLVNMAINRVAPFEQIAIDKNKNGVVGFQDAVILFSIMEHINTADSNGRSLLVSNDGIFYEPETRELLEKSGVKLEAIRSAGALWHELFDHFWPAVREPWLREMEQIEIDLNAQKDKLAVQIAGFINTSEFGKDLWVRAKVKKGFCIKKFDMVKLGLTEHQHRPPHATAYSRPEGSEVQISTRAAAEMDALVERTNSWMLIGGPPPDPNVAPVLEDATLSETLTVSLVGTVHGVICDFEVTAVEPYRP